jgi:hypothetical protein
MVKTVTLNADIPASRELRITLPADVPTGFAATMITVSPVPKQEKDDGRSSQFDPGAVPRGRVKRTRAECQRAGRFDGTRLGHSRRGQGDSWQGDYGTDASRAAKGHSNCGREGKRAWRDPEPGKSAPFPNNDLITHGMNNLARPPASGPFPFAVQT